MPAQTTMNVLDSFRLDGRLALVTGSSTGIGFALARGLAQAGARIVLNGRDADRLVSAASQLRADGIEARTQVFDVTDRAAVDAGIAVIEAEAGPIDILVNNAGGTRRGLFHELGETDWRTVMQLNLDSLFHVGQAVARRMVPRGRGRIINICSIMSEVGRPGVSAYLASKGAAKMLTKGMAIDLAPHGVGVNAIGPGYFETELTAPLRADEKFHAWITGRTPQRRWGRVEELAGAAVYLASDAASFVNGHLLIIDGGVTATL